MLKEINLRLINLRILNLDDEDYLSVLVKHGLSTEDSKAFTNGDSVMGVLLGPGARSVVSDPQRIGFLGKDVVLESLDWIVAVVLKSLDWIAAVVLKSLDWIAAVILQSLDWIAVSKQQIFLKIIQLSEADLLGGGDM
ncbi:unnamed protein product [Cyprideis torosa]|uniref:Uncharacterized protein n=1 Tax=Cyprideis torosa TaxID=163714 RepID=A0A7R8WQY5_9CRUS|nr:unnamed protein product [Cyprideis torosa]CAG0903041.1 unnamed protein product [Cyprideis torosa]